MTRTFRFVSLLAVPAIVAAIASTAYGHARMMSPAPRDNHSDYKSPPVAGVGTGEPCGVARTASQPSTNLTAGAAINLAWEETVDHNGCFVIDFSAANDQNFQVIARKSHANPPPRTGTGMAASRKYTMSVTLPTAACTACTLRVRQLMMTNDVAEANLATGCPPATLPAGASYYYSCANVVLGGGGASGTGGSAGGTGGATGTGGAGGRGGNAAGGRGGTSATAGTTGQTGIGGAAGTGQAGDTGNTGQSGSTGNTGSGQAGNGNSGSAGSTGGSTGAGGSGGDEATGGCNVTGGAPAPLALLLGIALLRSLRRRSRS